jgi:hypothetical protein
MRIAVAADHIHVVPMVSRLITLLAAGLQLACWIATLWQWFFGTEDSRFEGAKFIYRS